ncbi:MAG: hypothetical protein AAGF12_09790 [Myxococcota bacterium]
MGRIAALLLCVIGCGPCDPPPEPPVEPAPPPEVPATPIAVSHGPLVGGVRSDRARVWARAEASGWLHVRVLDSALPIQHGEATANTDFIATVAFTGLAAGEPLRIRGMVHRPTRFGHTGLGPHRRLRNRPGADDEESIHRRTLGTR